MGPRQRTESTWFPRAARAGCAGLALLFLLALAAIFAARAPHPFQLEWMEGGSVDHVRRLLAGDALYVRPGFDFVPYAYPPLYFALSALVSLATGVGLLPLRLVSIAATAATLWLLHALVLREGGDRLAAFVAAGAFAATFPLSGAWMDLARVDSLFLCAFCAALLFLRQVSLDPGGLRASACFALAFLAKQSALPMAIPCALYELHRERRRGARILLATGVLVAAASGALALRSEGWFAYYVFELPPARFASMLRSERALGLLAEHLLPRVPFLFGLALWLVHREWHRDRDFARFAALLALGMLGTSWWSMLEETAYANNLLPFHWCLCLLAGVALARARVSTTSGEGGRAASLVPGLMLLQLLLLAYDPRAHVPSRADLAAGRSLESRLAAEAQGLVMTHRPFFPALAREPITAHIHAINDVLRGDDGEAARGLEAELVRIFAGRRVAKLLVDDAWWFASDEVERAIRLNYRLSERFFGDEPVFWTRTGMPSRPSQLLVPIGAPPAAR